MARLQTRVVFAYQKDFTQMDAGGSNQSRHPLVGKQILKQVFLMLHLSLVLVATVALVGACETSEGPSGSDSTTESPGTDPEPGVISGVVTDTQGRPLQDAQVSIDGSSSAGENLNYQAATDGNGRYAVQVADGNYRVTGLISRDYLGRTWKLPLHPTDNSNNPVTSADGVSKNFQWVLQGPKPLEQIDNPQAYYGAYINVEPSNLLQFSSWPADAVVDFTLVPTGPLIDGSAGTTLTYKRTVAALNRKQAALNESKYLHDVPIGQYALTAKLTMPDRTVRALSLAPNFGSSFQERVDVKFQPTTLAPNTGADPMTVQVYTG